MNDNKLTFSENLKGMRLTAQTYMEFKKLAEEQIKKEEDLSDDDFNDVILSLVITKLLVAEGKLTEKYWYSAIS